MLELWQTEWCPASQRIRERLTELGIDYLTHQVPVEREQRTALRQVTGSDTIPTLLLADAGPSPARRRSAASSTSRSQSHPRRKRTG